MINQNVNGPALVPVLSLPKTESPADRYRSKHTLSHRGSPSTVRHSHQQAKSIARSTAKMEPHNQISGSYHAFRRHVNEHANEQRWLKP